MKSPGWSLLLKLKQSTWESHPFAWLCSTSTSKTTFHHLTQLLPLLKLLLSFRRRLRNRMCRCLRGLQNSRHLHPCFAYGLEGTTVFCKNWTPNLWIFLNESQKISLKSSHQDYHMKNIWSNIYHTIPTWSSPFILGTLCRPKSHSSLSSMHLSQWTLGFCDQICMSSPNKPTWNGLPFRKVFKKIHLNYSKIKNLHMLP